MVAALIEFADLLRRIWKLWREKLPSNPHK
jgi:hypothetical protein